MIGNILMIIFLVLVVILIVLFIFGKKAQKKQEASQAQIDAAAQTISMLIIDKKKMRLKDANLPSIVLENAPKLAKLTKLPVVKAKVGPKITTLLCDEKVFQQLPIKKECKVMVSGMYITKILNVRGGMVEAPSKKKGLLSKLRKNA